MVFDDKVQGKNAYELSDKKEKSV
jgi:hypothetical protein